MTVPVGAAGVRGLGGRGYLAYAAGGGAMSRGGGGAGSASYGLKIDKHAEEKLYDLLPGMELTPMSLKAAGIKPAPQVTRHPRTSKSEITLLYRRSITVNKDDDRPSLPLQK